MQQWNPLHRKQPSRFTATTFTDFPSKSLSYEIRSSIDQRLRQCSTNCKTPTHPPYALMIRTAITELSEEGGSTEEAISSYIKEEYGDGLPCGHTSFLSHHLKKLCGDGQIVLTGYGRYMLLLGKSDSVVLLDVEEESEVTGEGDIHQQIKAMRRGEKL